MIEGGSDPIEGAPPDDARPKGAPPPPEATTDPTTPDASAPPTQPQPDSTPPATPWDEPVAPGRRPRLGVLSVIGRSFDMFVWRPILFIAIGLVSGLLSAGFSLLTAGGNQDPIVAVGISLLVGAIGVATSLATMIAADDLRAGREATLGSVAGRAIERLVPGVVSLLIVGLATAGLMLVIGIPTVLVGFRVPIVLLAGFIVLFVAFILVFLRWSLALPAIALERVGPVAAIGRSATVVRGSLLRLVATWILLGLVMAPLSTAVGILSITGTDTLLAFALALLLGLVVAPISGIAFATIFGDLTGRPDAGTVEVDWAGRSILLGGVLVLGLAGLAIGLPKFGTAIGQIALRSVPAQDRGHLYAGTARNPGDACHPNGITTTFATSDQIWLGGYFTEAIPPGGSAQISVYANGQLVTSADVGGRGQPVACYYELRPLVGAPPGTYRLVVTYQGRTIGEGQFTVH